jgi:methylphosphotriester-DNA--protein-cysteine methyltransferase
MDKSPASSTRQIDELTFHQVERSNPELGICADLATLTTPMVAHRHDFLEYEVGISDSRYFATRFRHVFGITPSEFRNQSAAHNISNTRDKILKA